MGVNLVTEASLTCKERSSARTIGNPLLLVAADQQYNALTRQVTEPSEI